MDYDNLPAGPELNALVAERVMGWTHLTTGPGPLCGRHPATEKELHIYGLTGVPDYSGDIAAAWMIIEHFPLGTWNWRLNQQDSGLWAAEIRTGYATSYDKAFIATAPTVPLVICRAALRAVDSSAPE